METYLAIEAIEMRAARIPDGVLKLQFLRRELSRAPAEARAKKRMAIAPVLATAVMAGIFLLDGAPSGGNARAGVTEPRPAVAAWLTAPPAVEKIWLVETKPAYWVYSNGLQVRLDYLTESTVRHYKTWSRGDLAPSAAESTFPAGIVFHTTESLMLPLEENEAHSLVRTREAVLAFIRRGRLYNYLIDRFGQVFRIVPDEEVAFHAGHSVWADKSTVYEGLNASFLGIAFEARTDSSFVPEPAQVRSGRMLTDLLRSQFSIPEENCVTHAQVSVNPDNMQVGYHTDWGANFPFAALGLRNGYSTALPAVEVFGFGYSQVFVDAIGGTPWEGLLIAEAELRREAEARHMSTAAYRSLLHHQYERIRSRKNEPADSHRT